MPKGFFLVKLEKGYQAIVIKDEIGNLSGTSIEVLRGGQEYDLFVTVTGLSEIAQAIKQIPLIEGVKMFVPLEIKSET